MLLASKVQCNGYKGVAFKMSGRECDLSKKWLSSRGGGREGGREGCIWKEIQLKTSEGSIEIL